MAGHALAVHDQLLAHGEKFGFGLGGCRGRRIGVGRDVLDVTAHENGYQQREGERGSEDG
ncbi:hypothetical protein D3C72_2564370 [compost metagenome]